MAAFFPIPPVLTATKLTSVPSSLWSTRQTDWKPGTGDTPLVFIEGPTTDTQGNFFCIDVARGRAYKLVIRTGEWTLLAEWDGEPNGLALREDGMLVVADYKQGLLLLDPSTGSLTDLLPRRNLERFKGPNDLVVSSTGDIYFTDQGQTGMSDPTGRLYRLSPTGKLDCLLDNAASPNGVVLAPDEKALFLALTRENSVWRCPLHADGTTTKVNRFMSLFGSAGPDGLTVDSEGNLFVCHPSLDCIFVVTPKGLPLARIVLPEDCVGGALVNCIFGSTSTDRTRLYIVVATHAEVFFVDWNHPGGTPLRASKI